MLQELKALFKKYDEQDLIEARSLLQREIERYRLTAYKDLVRQINDQRLDTYVILGKSGTEYQIEVHGFWDDKKDGAVRMIMAIDGGPISAYRPVNRDFIKAPNGALIGE